MLLRDALNTALGGACMQCDLSDVPTIEIDAGTLLCDIGDNGDQAWVILRGRVAASTLDADGIERRVGVHGPGELIGEAALVETGTRQAKLLAGRRSQLAVLDRTWLTRLLTDEPDAAMAVVKSILDRRDQMLAQPTEIVAVAPLDTTVMNEARQIAETAAAMGSHTLLNPAEHPNLERAATEGKPGWLEQFETENGGVVLLGDPSRAAWTRAIAKIADRLILVIDADHGPEVSGAEQQLLDCVPRTANAARLLVLVHPAHTDRPRHTADWLVRRQVDRHLHLRRATAADLNRVARHSIGRPLTLAIGAGGVRSAAAVGTIEALTKRGVAVDAVAGVSGGAIVALWLSLLGTVEGLGDKTDWSMRKLLDYTLPVGSMISGGRAWSRIQQACGDRDIADTWLPLSIASTDLTLSAPANHVSGPLADAVYASVSIPGVFPPVDIDGHLHIDGAIFDAMPVEGARALIPEGPIMAIDLSSARNDKTEPLPRVMSGPRLLLRRMIPGLRAERVPSPIDTLVRSTTAGSANRRINALESVDCHVHLDLSEFSLLEFDKVRQVIALGETQSGAPLDHFLQGSQAPLTDPVLLDRPRNHGAIAHHHSGPQQLTGAALIGSLSLAWSDLRLRARRFAVAVAATSVVLALLLLMTGVVNQLNREPDVAVAAFGGSQWVVPAGADGVFTSSATFDESAVADIAADQAGRVLIARYRLADANAANDIDVILVGHTNLPGGGLSLVDGVAAEAPNEVVLSEGSGFAVGDLVRSGPVLATVTGLIAETTVFAGMPLMFVPLDSARSLVVEGQPLLSALVVDDVPELPTTLHVLPAESVAEDALGPIKKPIATLRLIEVLLALVAALIIGAVVFLATLDRLNDVAVLRAMGVGSGPIAAGVAAQALVIGLVAASVALGMQLLLAPVFPLRVHIDTADRLVMVAVSMVVAAAASYGAIRRTLRTDPAQAFAGPGA